MDRVMRGLLAVVGLGAAALVALIVLLIVTVSTHSHHSASRPARVTPVPRATRPPAKPTATLPVASAPSTTAAACDRRHTACRRVVLAVVNQARRGLQRSPLRYDAAQSDGGQRTTRSSPGGDPYTCSGSQGHSDAMAKSGRLWRKSSSYAHAGYPQDICSGVRPREEVVTSGTGPEQSALRNAVNLVLNGNHGTKARKRLLSSRYHRAGIGIAKRGNHYYVTIDLLG